MARRLLAGVCVCCLAWAQAEAGVVVRARWGPAEIRCTYPGTMKVVGKAKVPRLVFDLSALPPETRIIGASLRNTRVGQPTEPIRIFVVEKVAPDGGCAYGGKPLALEPPWHASFDAAAAVRRWVAEPKTTGKCPRRARWIATSRA